MYIDPQWRILTVGDGDLSFSEALFRTYNPKLLTATVLDTRQTLLDKYSDNSLQALEQLGVRVITEFDITRPSTWSAIQSKYDLVIFQFPLVPGIKSKQQYNLMHQHFGADFSINTLNRRLLRKFLQFSFSYLLSPQGARLAYISSKDVKPYTEWNIEDQIAKGLDCSFLGSEAFYVEQFKGYQIRNVDRDKHVKQTKSLTYVWSDIAQPKLDLTTFHSVGSTGCEICRAGPFATEQEKQAHQASAKHTRMADFDRQWQAYLVNSDK